MPIRCRYDAGYTSAVEGAWVQLISLLFGEYVVMMKENKLRSSKLSGSGVALYQWPRERGGGKSVVHADVCMRARACVHVCLRMCRCVCVCERERVRVLSLSLSLSLSLPRSLSLSLPFSNTRSMYLGTISAPMYVDLSLCSYVIKTSKSETV